MDDAERDIGGLVFGQQIFLVAIGDLDRARDHDPGAAEFVAVCCLEWTSAETALGTPRVKAAISVCRNLRKESLVRGE